MLVTAFKKRNVLGFSEVYWTPMPTRDTTSLRKIRHLVISDPAILGGDPPFRGTRVPVHLIADLVAQGAAKAELLGDYPRLTAEMTRLAPVCATAYPLCGGPRRQPWHDQPPIKRAPEATSEALF
jgi:uncharacterized protein (DUF433 family)